MTTAVAIGALALLFARWADAGTIAGQWRQRRRRRRQAPGWAPPRFELRPGQQTTTTGAGDITYNYPVGVEVDRVTVGCDSIGRFGEHCEREAGHAGAHRGEGGEWE